ncbi:MAG: L,D-transpeptidase [Deltaproteobacteria bacterium]|nr:L,D-transpeptidase [Deltaproteobacteria bacterium]
MRRAVVAGVCWALVGPLIVLLSFPVAAQVGVASYRIEPITGGLKELKLRFDPLQLGLLEKLNRRDLDHMGRLSQIVVAAGWNQDELALSPLPRNYPVAAAYAKLIVVQQPFQVFGAYEYGRLVRWGPVSTGRRSRPTPYGLFHLNWRSVGRHSTVDADWYMRWYFNFDNRQGLSLHEYELPGFAASHACVRLLARDARWIFDWAEGWQLSANRKEVIRPGTPLYIVGAYDFGNPPPWMALEHLSTRIVLPEMISEPDMRP